MATSNPPFELEKILTINIQTSAVWPLFKSALPHTDFLDTHLSLTHTLALSHTHTPNTKYTEALCFEA